MSILLNGFTAAVPRTSTPRPQLPYANINPFLSMADNARVPAVKYQVILRDGQEIIVGRVKIQTPANGHAFVLRRFDTGAISQTTMFRAAFPSASDDVEKSESAWIKANFDSTGANGGAGRDTLRLAGVWVHPEVAITLAPLYQLEHVVAPLMNAQPDPRQEYRRSTKPSTPQSNGSASIAAAAAAAASSSPTKPPGRFEIPATSSPAASPKPAKRRKETSPMLGNVSPRKAALDALPVPTPRRSGRVTSPTPVAAQAPAPLVHTTRTRVTKTTTKVSVKPEVSSGRLTPEADDYDEDVPDVPGPDMYADIAEQKDIIDKLKAERRSSVPLQASESKRSREDEEEEKKLEFKFVEPGEQEPVATRAMVSNRRLAMELEPQQKSAAWGALWFAAGLAAAATIPSFFL